MESEGMGRLESHALRAFNDDFRWQPGVLFVFTMKSNYICLGEGILKSIMLP